jgi:hypothetical protein
LLSSTGKTARTVSSRRSLLADSAAAQDAASEFLPSAAWAAQRKASAMAGWFCAVGSRSIWAIDSLKAPRQSSSLAYSMRASASVGTNETTWR